MTVKHWSEYVILWKYIVILQKRSNGQKEGLEKQFFKGEGLSGKMRSLTKGVETPVPAV